MVLTNNTLTIVREAFVDYFDNFDYAAVGDSITSFNTSQTTLVNEFYRNLVYSVSKDLPNGNYDITIIIPATQSNGHTIAEVGIFDATSGGNMGFREVLSTPKSFVLEEVRIIFRINVAVS